MTTEERPRVSERGPSVDNLANRLKGLQRHAAAPYDWNEFKQRSFDRRGAPWQRTAIAASVVLVLAGIAGWMRYSVGDGLGQVGDSSLDEPIVTVSRLTGFDAQSATSEWLANLPSEPAIVRVDSRLPVVELEDRIAWVDDLLNTAQVESGQPAHIQTLRRERAQLISSLARVRYAETLAADR